MITFTVDDYTNGSSVVGFDTERGKLVRETYERRIDTLTALKRAVDKLLERESKLLAGAFVEYDPKKGPPNHVV